MCRAINALVMAEDRLDDGDSEALRKRLATAPPPQADIEALINQYDAKHDHRLGDSLGKIDEEKANSHKKRLDAATANTTQMTAAHLRRARKPHRLLRRPCR